VADVKQHCLGMFSFKAALCSLYITPALWHASHCIALELSLARQLCARSTSHQACPACKRHGIAANSAHQMYGCEDHVHAPAVGQQHRLPDWLHQQHSTVLQSETIISTYVYICVLLPIFLILACAGFTFGDGIQQQRISDWLHHQHSAVLT